MRFPNPEMSASGSVNAKNSKITSASAPFLGPKSASAANFDERAKGLGK